MPTLLLNKRCQCVGYCYSKRFQPRGCKESILVKTHKCSILITYGSPYLWDKVVLTKFISGCRMVWDLICGTSWFYKSKTEKVTGGGKSVILPNCFCLLSITVLSSLYPPVYLPNPGSMHNGQLTFTYSTMTNIDHFKLILRVFFFLYSQQRQVSTFPVSSCTLNLWVFPRII